MIEKEAALAIAARLADQQNYIDAFSILMQEYKVHKDGREVNWKADLWNVLDSHPDQNFRAHVEDRANRLKDMTESDLTGDQVIQALSEMYGQSEFRLLP